MNAMSSNYRISLGFRPVSLPPVRDILVLGKKFPQGKAGVMECFRFIAPDEFEMFDIEDGGVAAEAVLINKRLLRRMPAERVIAVLEQHVFPYMSNGEAINVDFEVKINITGLEILRDE